MNKILRLQSRVFFLYAVSAVIGSRPLLHYEKVEVSILPDELGVLV